MTTKLAISNFRTEVLDYYRQYGRHELPWRQTTDPYYIMVSELMLQQTQVGRVIPKYQAFLEQFPSVESLASAELGDVLRAWSGLGYNRRAKFLHAAAQKVVTDFKATFPRTSQELQTLPGVGVNTAGAIAAYAFNQPVVFIETNIRTVFIHHFFKDQADIPDSAIHELVADALDTANPRDWYWALMDYGSHLKQTVGNLNKQSKTYAKQSTFQGSRRQLRGQVLRLLAAKTLTRGQLEMHITDQRLQVVIDDLLQEGLIRTTDQHRLSL